MRTWTVQQAEASITKLLDACQTEGPQMLTQRGAEVAVLLPVQVWLGLQSARPTLKELLLGGSVRTTVATAQRRATQRRKIEPLA
ncbi:type II toxin-antitoxin system Phd/YefM family antitoxin [Ideonella sp.]|uniref:type II toxin-antitoxin system Phd/YefM family antitoxin n=1 Tax=Ideonella sp. TaxID=1929293 RepID=UPI003BB4D458